MTNSDAQLAVLPEYQDNPFIAALPPLWSTKETYDRLLLQPVFDPRERQFPDHVRPHCIMRLFRYFDPLEQHLTLASRFGMLVRQGYIRAIVPTRHTPPQNIVHLHSLTRPLFTAAESV